MQFSFRLLFHPHCGKNCGKLQGGGAQGGKGEQGLNEIYFPVL